MKLFNRHLLLFCCCCSFCVNIGPSESEFTMHINPRFNAHGDENVVVCNSYQGGSWCEEVRPGGFPFKQGEEFKVGLPRKTPSMMRFAHHVAVGWVLP